MPKKLNFLGGMQNYDPNNGQYEPALVGANGEIPQKFTSFKKPKEEKKESLDDYTNFLFEKLGIKTYSSKKYKNPSGEIIEIRRFGEGKNAIKYNKTKDIVEQVWYNGEKVN